MAGFGNLGIALGNAAGTFEQGQQLQLQQQNQKSLENYRTQELQLQQQGQQNAQKRFEMQQQNEAFQGVVKHLEEWASQAKTANPDISPQDLTRPVQGMLDAGRKLGQSAGLPVSLDAIWAGIAAMPSPAKTARVMAEAKDPLKGAKEQSEIDLKKAQADYYSGRTSAATLSDSEIDKIGTYQQAPPPNNPRNPGAFHDQMSKIYTRYPDYDPSNFKTTQAAKGADVRADSNALSKLVQQREAISSFEKTAIKNGDILVNLAEKVDKTGIPVIERWIRAGRQATGDADVAKFNAQMQAYRTEVAKILTNPNLTGQLTDSARKEVEHFLSGSASAQQIKAVHELLKGDFGRRMESLDEGISGIKSRLKGATGVTVKPAYKYNAETGELERQ